MKTLFSKFGWLSIALLINLLTSAQVWAEYEEIIYYHNDALGSPVMASDANGNVKWEEDYMPFGKRLEYQSQELVNGEPQEDAWDETVWYTGKQEEARLGLVYMGARWYDPSVGRFLAMDPAGVREYVGNNPMMFNRYVYVNNNPYRYIDPDGRVAIPLELVALTGIGTLIYYGTCNSSNPSCEAARGLGKRLDNSIKGLISSIGGMFNDTADSEIEGATEGLEPVKDERGRDRKGQYVDESGRSAQDILDGLTGEIINDRGDKQLPDGSVAGVHPSSGSSGGKAGEFGGSDTVHINRPKGKQDIKIRVRKKR